MRQLIISNISLAHKVPALSHPPTTGDRKGEIINRANALGDRDSIKWQVIKMDEIT